MAQILKAQGLLKSSGMDEVSRDARPLLFAAYHNQANAVRQMMAYGFEIGKIDPPHPTPHVSCSAVEYDTAQRDVSGLPSRSHRRFVQHGSIT